MTEQEAIKRIKECMNTPNFQPYFYVNEALNMAITAIEKQIPRKIMRRIQAVTIRSCPVCDQIIAYEKQPYCSSCGQKLNWN